MDGDLRASQGHRLAQSHAAHCGAELKSEVCSSRTRAGSPGRSKQTTKGRRQKESLLGSCDWETGFSKRKRHRRREKQAGVSEAGGRRATPPPTPASQGKASGKSFPTDGKSRRRTTGQLREGAGPCSDHVSRS